MAVIDAAQALQVVALAISEMPAPSAWYSEASASRPRRRPG
jgi:hypothetical protein